ncbi:MAG: low specificity L-threonine aldolase [Oscillospiraceae bacterium]|nr:low specificity L-threonine aldolase [Oscillospiraceae bacterium]
MEKLYFASDYQEGAHPAVLRRLCETNLLKTPGYGLDGFCEAAREKIRAACSCPGAAVHFLCGGTQANAVVIDAFLQPWQGVLAAESGHISSHEAGAIEWGGHKVLTLPQQFGKLRASVICDACERWNTDANRAHMVMPGMAYISQPTEYGTLYSLAELEEISGVCRAFGIPLYLDGARLAYALACPGNDVTLPDLARLCDVFYIGGTKCGALFGEAVVISDSGRMEHFFTIMKQHGALMAKGRLLGLQFDALFTDGLYLSIGLPAIHAAERLRGEFLDRFGWRLAFASPTNQIFVLLDNPTMERVAEKVEFSFWEKNDDSHSIVRFATSWATRPEEVDALIAAIE